MSIDKSYTIHVLQSSDTCITEAYHALNMKSISRYNVYIMEIYVASYASWPMKRIPRMVNWLSDVIIVVCSRFYFMEHEIVTLLFVQSIIHCNELICTNKLRCCLILIFLFFLFAFLDKWTTFFFSFGVYSVFLMFF